MRRHFPGVKQFLRGAWIFRLFCLFLLGGCVSHSPSALVLRITDWQTNAVYVEAPAQTGSQLSFAWIHSLEKIPWHEYYHVDEHRNLILDVVTFPAFGAGIPEDKGGTTYIKDGLIHMADIRQVFPELVWLNSHMATQALMLDGILIARGNTLPEHTRLRLAIEKR